jgi:hypothetical protein
LIVTATTGSAAVKIGGTTLHTAVSIPIETPNGQRVGKLKKKQMEVWKQAQYTHNCKTGVQIGHPGSQNLKMVVRTPHDPSRNPELQEGGSRGFEYPPIAIPQARISKQEFEYPPSGVQ